MRDATKTNSDKPCSTGHSVGRWERVPTSALAEDELASVSGGPKIQVEVGTCGGAAVPVVEVTGLHSRSS